MRISAQELLELYAAGERDFSGIELAGSELAFVDLSGIDLSNAGLGEKYLEGVNFSAANLRNTHLVQQGRSSRAEGRRQKALSYKLFYILKLDSYFSQAALGQSCLNNANFRDADLSGANLGHAGLKRADLTNAKLVNTYLGGADMIETNLTGADLTGALMDDAWMERVIFHNTIMPDGSRSADNV